MAPDRIFFLFFISGILGTKGGWNVLVLYRYFDFTGITFAILRRFRELAWIGVGWLRLALSGGRSLATE